MTKLDIIDLPGVLNYFKTTPENLAFQFNLLPAEDYQRFSLDEIFELISSTLNANTNLDSAPGYVRDFMVYVCSYKKNHDEDIEFIDHIEPPIYEITPGKTIRYIEGNPAIVRELKNDGEITEFLVLKPPKEEYAGGLLNHIKKFEDTDGNAFIMYNNSQYTYEEFIKYIDGETGSTKKWVRKAIDILPVQTNLYHTPNFFIENNHLLFPGLKNIVTAGHNTVQQLLVDSLHIGPINHELEHEGFDLLTPKQKLVHYAIAGQTILNMLQVEDFNFTLDLLGDPDTGKSWAILYSLWRLFGISQEFKFKNDALSSSWREMDFLASTNFPIYIEEGKITPKLARDLKSAGNGARGTANQTMNIYTTKASLIISRNSEETDSNPVEEQAEKKRFLKFYFKTFERITEKATQFQGKQLMRKIHNAPGGVLYDILQNISVDDIISKYIEYGKVAKDIREAVVKLGAWLLNEDISYLAMDFGSPDVDDPLEQIGSWYVNLQEALVDLDTNTYLKKYVKPLKNGSELTSDGYLKITSEVYSLFLIDHRNFPYNSLNNCAIMLQQKYPEFIKYGSLRINSVAYRGLAIDVVASDVLNSYWAKINTQKKKEITPSDELKTLRIKALKTFAVGADSYDAGKEYTISQMDALSTVIYNYLVNGSIMVINTSSGHPGNLISSSPDDKGNSSATATKPEPAKDIEATPVPEKHETENSHHDDSSTSQLDSSESNSESSSNSAKTDVPKEDQPSMKFFSPKFYQYRALKNFTLDGYAFTPGFRFQRDTYLQDLISYGFVECLNCEQKKETNTSELKDAGATQNSNPAKPIKYKTHYYQVTQNYEKYSDSGFLQGSDIKLESSRLIYKKKTSEIKYGLIKLKIPDKLETDKTPAGWKQFLRDSTELPSEAAFNILSRGDSQ